jgi:hypothetical protein
MNDDSSNGSPFHDVGSIFPGDVDLVSVEPSTTVADALRLMAPNRYSQVSLTTKFWSACGIGPSQSATALRQLLRSGQIQRLCERRRMHYHYPGEE